MKDRVFAVGSLALTVATIPALFDQIHTPMWTAATTTVVLAVFAATYVYMQFYLAAVMATAQVFLWTAILIEALH